MSSSRPSRSWLWRLNPNDSETLADIGHYLAFMGEFRTGVAPRGALRNSIQYQIPAGAYFSFARLDYNRKAYDGTIRWVEKIGIYPHFYWTHLL